MVFGVEVGRTQISVSTGTEAQGVMTSKKSRFCSPIFLRLVCASPSVLSQNGLGHKGVAIQLFQGLCMDHLATMNLWGRLSPIKLGTAAVGAVFTGLLASGFKEELGFTRAPKP